MRWSPRACRLSDYRRRARRSNSPDAPHDQLGTAASVTANIPPPRVWERWELIDGEKQAKEMYTAAKRHLEFAESQEAAAKDLEDLSSGENDRARKTQVSSTVSRLVALSETATGDDRLHFLNAADSVIKAEARVDVRVNVRSRQEQAVMVSQAASASKVAARHAAAADQFHELGCLIETYLSKQAALAQVLAFSNAGFSSATVAESKRLSRAAAGFEQVQRSLEAMRGRPMLEPGVGAALAKLMELSQGGDEALKAKVADIERRAGIQDRLEQDGRAVSERPGAGAPTRRLRPSRETMGRAATGLVRRLRPSREGRRSKDVPKLEPVPLPAPLPAPQLEISQAAAPTTATSAVPDEQEAPVPAIRAKPVEASARRRKPRPSREAMVSGSIMIPTRDV